MSRAPDLGLVIHRRGDLSSKPRKHQMQVSANKLSLQRGINESGASRSALGPELLEAASE
jgi:hypothetical protein